MPIVPIESLDDPRLDAYRHLKRTNATRYAGRLIVEGEKLARRLLESPLAVESLLLSDKFLPQWQGAAPDGTPVYVIADALVEELVGFNFHRGILACGVRPENPALEDIAPPGPLTAVVCPDVQDPENLGAILRTSAAFGASGVIVGPEAPDPLSRRVLRVSMGAALRVPIRRTREIALDLRRLSEGLGVQLAATVLDPSAEPLSFATRPERLALCFGSEGHGLSPEIIALCDRRLTIPMAPGTDSLNVAVAAAIFLHELRFK